MTQPPQPPVSAVEAARAELIDALCEDDLTADGYESAKCYADRFETAIREECAAEIERLNKLNDELHQHYSMSSVQAMRREVDDVINRWHSRPFPKGDSAPESAVSNETEPCSACTGRGIVTDADFENGIRDIPCPACQPPTDYNVHPQFEVGQQVVFAVRYYPVLAVRREPVGWNYYYYLQERDGRVSRVAEEEIEDGDTNE